MNKYVRCRIGFTRSQANKKVKCVCVFQRGGGRQRCRRHRRTRIISRVRRTGMVCVSPGMCGHHRGWRQREWLYLWLHSTRLSRYENQHTVDSKSPLLCINIFIFEGATRFAANPVWPCHLRETDLQGRSEPYVPGELNNIKRSKKVLWTRLIFVQSCGFVTSASIATLSHLRFSYFLIRG